MELIRDLVNRIGPLLSHLSLHWPILSARLALALKHIVLQSVVQSRVPVRVPEMDGVALCDLLVLGDVARCNQDRALVHAAPQGIRVTAVVDKGKAGVDGAAHLLP